MGSDRRSRRHQFSHPGSELPVNDPYDRRLFSTNRGTELGRRWHFYKPNAPSIQQRHDLVQTVRRCVGGNDGERELVALRCFAYLLHTHDRPTTPHSQSEQAEHPLPHDIIHRDSPASDSSYAALSPSPPRPSSPP